MKKKALANGIMVAVIAAIMIAGVVTVGVLRGWFDSADGDALLLTELSGTVNMERNGVFYPVKNDTVLHSGDKIVTNPGASAAIQLPEGTATLNGNLQLTVNDPSPQHPVLGIAEGELFVNSRHPVKLHFSDHTVTVEQACAAVSVRAGAQTLLVFRGTVGETASGQSTEYTAGSVSTHPLQAASLNDFLIAQIRKTNKTAELCFTDNDLDALEETRRQAIQQLLESDDVLEEHTHEYTATVVAPGCVSPGYTEYRCAACGDVYKSDETVPAGHSWEPWSVAKKASARETGLRKRNCTVCGTTEEETIGKIDENHVHNYTAQVVSPSCETPGYTVHQCACGDTYTDAEKKATGHSWSEWITVKNATETETGVKERACRSCGKKEQQTLPVAAPAIEGYVSLSIVCHTVLDHMEDLKPGKEEFIPANGVILPTVKVAYYKDETVFDVLRRACKKTGIALEASDTPLYKSYYVEGIGHLYEFDCGEQSGWTYKVNEWFPNYGASGYYVSDGDVIAWCYTCRGLGADVSGGAWNE